EVGADWVVRTGTTRLASLGCPPNLGGQPIFLSRVGVVYCRPAIVLDKRLGRPVMRSVGIALCCLLLFSVAAFGQGVTFNKNVLPILQARCQSCHRPGEVAPMSFLSYQTTRPWAKAMKAAVIERKMPPGGLDPRYGHFVENFSLSQTEIDTIAKWADAGAVEGDPKDALPPVQWVEGWRSKPDLVIEAPPFNVPAKGWVENMIKIGRASCRERG